MWEDYLLKPSVGYIHTCFIWAHQQIHMEDYWQFVLSNFSGVLCIDEVHDSGKTILFATDPLNDFTVSFQIAKKNDQIHMDAFLQTLKDRGLEVEIVITDGSPLYKDCLQGYWFEKGISKTLARQRRTRLVNNPAYQDNAFVQKALMGNEQCPCTCTIKLFTQSQRP